MGRSSIATATPVFLPQGGRFGHNIEKAVSSHRIYRVLMQCNNSYQQRRVFLCSSSVDFIQEVVSHAMDK